MSGAGRVASHWKMVGIDTHTKPELEAPKRADKRRPVFVKTHQRHPNCSARSVAHVVP